MNSRFFRPFMVIILVLTLHCDILTSGEEETGSTTTLAGLLLVLGMGESQPSSINETTQTVASPVFSPTPGTFNSTQTVSISTTTSGDTIRYTDNGTDPTCSSGVVYSGTISVPASITIKAIGCKSGMLDSSVVSGAYTISGTTAAPTFSKAGGTYTSNLSITLASTTPTSTIRYTTNGIDPECPSTGTLYSSAVALTTGSTVTLKAIACRSGFTDSTVTSATYDLSSTTPTSSVSPTSGNYLQSSVQIKVTFSESMNTGSLSISGTIGSRTNAWSQTNMSNDTLTISPLGSWNNGFDRTMVINVNDAAGNPAATINLEYDVIAGKVIYVKTSGSDSNDGLTPATAKRNIQSAIAAAVSGDIVLVAGGTYEVGSLSGVAIKNGVSVYGGYNTDFTVRNPSSTVSTISDTCISSSCSTIGALSITTSTTFDGFTIQGASFGSPSVIFVSSSNALTISNNILQAGNANGLNSYGIWLNSSSISILKNKILMGSGAQNIVGIVIGTSGSPIIRNNVIHGGSATSVSNGIQSGTGSPTIQNNTINGGTAGTAAVALSIANSTPTVENNILFNEAGTGFCVMETTNSSLSSFRNNLLFNCSTLYLDGGSTSYTNICSGNLGNSGCTTTMSSPVGTGNVGSSPAFANQASKDYTFTTSTPCGISQGGLDLSSDFTLDILGATRTTPFSIGAYEYNGSCL